MNNRFVYLDFLRFAFAMIVFFGHAKGLLVMEKFQLAVDYFFILSGFVLTHAYKDKLSRPGFLLSFARDRVARLYPLHLITLAIIMGMNIWFTEITNGQLLEDGWSYQDGRAYTLMLNFGMLNNVGLSPSGPSWNAPAWSISVEFWINILIAAVALLTRRLIVALAAMAFFICYFILFKEMGSLGDYYKNLFGWLNVGLLRGLAGMSAGMLCYAAYVKLKPMVEGRKNLVTGMAFSLVAVQFWMIGGGLKLDHSDFLIVPVSAITVVMVALAESMRQASAFDKPLEWLGECSYAIYMTHWIVLDIINYFMIYAWKIDVNIKQPLHFIAMAATVIILARLSFVYIETPGKKIIKGLKNEKNTHRRLFNNDALNASERNGIN
ncbi:acyltransferase family protein [Pseudomonas chlororaphis]|uniref:acyltransferase family protein n=1 Tax=Pseudomonas chlororaphis TaxID=587753 RepID=UPI0039E50A75